MSISSSSILRLPDNRFLEYATFGDLKSDKVIVYFHGFLGSCHQAAFADSAAQRLGLRIIAPNRPGIGQSTPHMFASMVAYTKDIKALLDSLHISKATFMGVSSGGCFALACTYAMPERVQLTGVAGCIGPLNVIKNMQNMQWFRRIFLSLCNNHPWTIGSVLRTVYIVCKYRPQWLYQWLVNTSCLLEPGLQKPTEMVKTMLWNDYQDVFLHKNGVIGLVQEARLFFHWGFSLRDFPKQKRVLFWHGRNDTLVPWSVARDLTRHIPKSEVILCPGGHMTFLTKIEQILQRISQDWDASRTMLQTKTFPQQSEILPDFRFA